MTDMVLAGKISNVQKQNGVSQMGREWTSTSFNLERVKVKKGQNGVYENYTESIPLSGLGDFAVVNGGVYQVGVDIKVRQSQKGDFYPNLSVQWTEAIYIPQQNNGYHPQPQQNYQPQQNNNFGQQFGPNGQESFRNDDIPF